MYNKLKNICKEKGTNVTNLCEIVTGNSGNLATWKKGYMRSDYLMKSAKYLGVTSDYLLGLDDVPNRKSQSPKLSEDKKRLLEMYDKLTDMEKGEILGELKVLTKDKYISIATAARHGSDDVSTESLSQGEIEDFKNAKGRNY